MPEVVLRNDEQLLAAIPAMFGYTPAESLILVALRYMSNIAARFDLALRVELADIGEADAAGELARRIDSDGIARIYGIIVADHDNATLPYQDEVRSLEAQLHERGLGPTRWVHLTCFARGAAWSRYDDPTITGKLPDPASSVVTTVAVTSGERIFASREELAQQFTPLPADDRSRTAVEVDRVIRAVQLETVTGNRAALRRRLDQLDRALGAAIRGSLPSDQATIAELLGAVTSGQLRDAVLRPLPADHMHAAQSLWLHLWRHALPPVADILIGLITATAYLRGDGATVRVATDHENRPGQFTDLLNQGLTIGLHPSRLREILTEISASARAQLHDNNSSH